MQDLTPFYSALVPDLAALEALVAGERPGTTQDGLAFLHHDDNAFSVWNLAAPPQGATAPNDVTLWVTTASMDSTVSRDVQTQVTLEINSHLGDEVNTLRAYLQFCTGYWDNLNKDANGNPTLLCVVPRCLVGFQIPVEQIDDQGGGTIYQVTGYDRSWKIRDLYLQNVFVRPAGMPATQVVYALLQMDNDTPSEGGRSPSGTAIAGTGAPQGSFVTSNPVGDNPYCSTGVFAHTVATLEPDGYLLSPDGRWFYNPDASIRIDATTYFPIDPWTCNPMTVPLDTSGVPMLAYANTAVASNGLWFNTKTGAFYKPYYPFGTGYGGAAWDPFKNTLMNQDYYHPDATVPTVTDGTARCPLNSFPQDYDGTGPYFTSGGGGQTTSGGGSTTTAGPAHVDLGVLTTVASRFGSGSETIIPAGSYTIQAGVCSSDPLSLGHVWCVPRTGVYDSLSTSVGGWIWPGGTWTISLALYGQVLPAGTAAISADLFFRAPDGTKTHIAAFAQGPSQSFAPTSGGYSLGLQCQATVGGITAPPGAVLDAEITLVAITDLTATLSVGAPSTVMQVMAQQAGFPVPSIPANTPITTSGGNASAAPIYTGTTIPWPDSNHPGLLPSNCESPGPNFPASDIVVVHSPVPAPVSTPYGRDTNLLALCNQELDAVAWRPIGVGPTGTIYILPQPLFSEGIPTPVWSFRTDERQVIKPPASRTLGDQTGLFNKIVIEVQNNNGPLFVKMFTNTSVTSEISRPNLGRWVMGKAIQNDQIPDLTTLDRFGQLQIQKAASAYETVEVVVATVPWLELFDPIELYIISVDGDVKVTTGPYCFFITAIQEDLLDPTSMKLTLARMVPV